MYTKMNSIILAFGNMHVWDDTCQKIKNNTVLENVSTMRLLLLLILFFEFQ